MQRSSSRCRPRPGSVRRPPRPRFHRGDGLRPDRVPDPLPLGWGCAGRWRSSASRSRCSCCCDVRLAAPLTASSGASEEPSCQPDPAFSPARAQVARDVAPSAQAPRGPAGEAVITEGEVGDRFYIVERAGTTATHLAAGARQGPGDPFGEIALLRDVPHPRRSRPTRTPVLLYPGAIPRRGHRQQREVAGRVDDLIARRDPDVLTGPRYERWIAVEPHDHRQRERDLLGRATGRRGRRAATARGARCADVPTGCTIVVRSRCSGEFLVAVEADDREVASGLEAMALKADRSAPNAISSDIVKTAVGGFGRASSVVTCSPPWIVKWPVASRSGPKRQPRLDEGVIAAPAVLRTERRRHRGRR